MNGRCERCGSYAINHHSHGRDGSDAELCDVCYWRKRAESVVAAAPEPVAWLVEYSAPATRLAPAGIARRVVFTHNAIADYREIDPNATSTPLYR